MNKQYGYFTNDGQQYVITDPATPRHWYNYLWNDRYVAFTSQVGYGEGFTQDDMGRRVILVINRNLYMIDCEDHEFWTANALPVDKGYSNYQCTHGIGYSEIKLEYRNIETTFRIFVPREDACEVWSLTIKNRRQTRCKLKAIPYIKTAMDGRFVPQSYQMGRADFVSDTQAIVSRFFARFSTDEFTPVYGYMMGSEQVTGYDTRNDAFVGAYADDSRPDAVVKGGCQNSDCYSEKLCYVLENSVELEAGEEITLHYVAGVTLSQEAVADVRRRLLTNDGVQKEFDATVSKLAADIDGVFIDTPDEGLNNLFNGFLKHQTSLGSRWARVRHNGFRDTNCDCECLGIVNPRLAWARAKRIISYQYSNGYAPRTFIDGVIRDNGHGKGKYMDNTVWITYNVHSLLKELGDLSILDEVVPFNDGSEATVYEHLRRSVDFLWNSRGELGLVKHGGGDWNDCMELVGIKGKGMSVWLSIAWYWANKQFAEISRLCGNSEQAELAEARGREMQRIVNDAGWDGAHYLAAYTDDGEKIGSMENDEGKMHLIPQAWSVMAGIGEDGKEVRAMDAVEEHMNTDLGVTMTWPSYTYYRPDIGATTWKLPGVHENGGVYIHAYTWKMAADCILKRNDKVQENLEKMLPDNHKWVEKKAEPYIMCNSYFPKDASYRYATPGQSWRTGSGAWFLKDVAYYVLGLQPEMEGLRLNPCLPPDWKTCSVTKKFRGAEYHITYEQLTSGGCNHIKEITVNSEPHHSDILPWQDNGRFTVRVVLD